MGQPNVCFYGILTPLLVAIATKVDGPKSITYLTLTSIFEWSVDRCEFKTGYQKDTCLEEIRLRAQRLPTILSTTLNIFKRIYMIIDHLMSKRIFTLAMKKIHPKLHISISRMPLLLLYPETLGNGCSQLKSHPLLSCFSPIYHRL